MTNFSFTKEQRAPSGKKFEHEIRVTVDRGQITHVFEHSYDGNGYIFKAVENAKYFLPKTDPNKWLKLLKIYKHDTTDLELALCATL